MKRKKTKNHSIDVPVAELDMFAKYGVKTIVAGNTRYRLVKKPSNGKKKQIPSN
jgi:hypothetical protein